MRSHRAGFEVLFRRERLDFLPATDNGGAEASGLLTFRLKWKSESALDTLPRALNSLPRRRLVLILEQPSMSTHPENDPQREDLPEPIHGQVRHSNVSARISDDVSVGVFSNGVMILSGQHESVLDFAMRMGETQRIVTRVILPNPVARQFGTVLQENMRLYESNFGTMPSMPKLKNAESSTGATATPSPESGLSSGGGGGSGGSLEDDVPAEPTKVSPLVPSIDEIYDELKIPESVASGRYANAVMVRHSGTEFCFDFIANFYPRSVVTSRVYMAVPHVPPVLSSILRSMQPPASPGPGGFPTGPSPN